MSRPLTSDDLDKMTHSKYVITEEIEFTDKQVFGDNKHHKLTFDIYDGFAFCENYKGKSYYMQYPKQEFIDKAPNMQKSIREHLNLDDAEPIRIVDILHAYSSVYVLE